jgi:proteasome-associated ATPase
MNRQSPVALKYPPHQFLVWERSATMGDSERSEAFGTPRESSMSSDDAAELEQLRREAAVLREQIEQVAESHGGARSARGSNRLTCVTQFQINGNS